MELWQAEAVANEVVDYLRLACHHLAVAGSVRRRQPEVKDVEIAYVPRMVESPINLLEVGLVPATVFEIDDLVVRGVLRFDEEVKRDGPKYKRLVHGASGIVVELFRAQPENWGLILAIRTGPAVFNKILVSRIRGAMPFDMKMDGGFLWRRGIRLDTPTEAQFFAELRLPCWPPEERTASKLWAFLRERASHSDGGTSPDPAGKRAPISASAVSE